MTAHYPSQPGGPEGAGGYIYIYIYMFFFQKNVLPHSAKLAPGKWLVQGGPVGGKQRLLSGALTHMRTLVREV